MIGWVVFAVIPLLSDDLVRLRAMCSVLPLLVNRGLSFRRRNEIVASGGSRLLYGPASIR